VSSRQYNFGSLWLFLNQLNHQISYQEYFKLAEKYQVELVSKVDQEDIQNYFTGKTEFSDSIDQELKASLLQKRLASKQAKVEELQE